MDWITALTKAAYEEVKDDPEWLLVDKIWNVQDIVSFVKIRERSTYMMSEAFAATLKQLKPPLSLLDVGCGYGRFSFLFAERGINVTGIDPNPVPIRIAKRAVEILGWKNLKFKKGTIESVKGKFDRIFYGFLLHNMIEESVKQIDFALQHLVPKGKVLILDFEQGFDKLKYSYNFHILRELGTLSHGHNEVQRVLLVDITK